EIRRRRIDAPAARLIRQEPKELGEITLVRADGVGGGVFVQTKIFEKGVDLVAHAVVQLSGSTLLLALDLSAPRHVPRRRLSTSPDRRAHARKSRFCALRVSLH